MANFSKAQIDGMLTQLRDEFGPDIATEELALLELEDMQRKGCALEYAYRFECCACSKGPECPVLTWEKRHPEYANDELAMKIRTLEAGGEEAYNARLKAQEEAKKKQDEAKQKLQNLKNAIDATVIKIRNETGDDKMWWKELDENIEAYVQARINEKI